MNSHYRLEWHWLNLDEIFTTRGNNFLRLLHIAREFERCEWCIRDMTQDVVLAQSKHRKRWELGNGE